MARRKIQKNSLTHHDGKKTNSNKGRDGMVKNVALGATGLAITAGVVAVGAAMINKNMRNKMGKAVEGGVQMLRENAAKAPEQAQKYMATAHQIPGMRKRRSKSRRGSKSEIKPGI